MSNTRKARRRRLVLRAYWSSSPNGCRVGSLHSPDQGEYGQLRWNATLAKPTVSTGRDARTDKLLKRPNASPSLLKVGMQNQSSQKASRTIRQSTPSRSWRCHLKPRNYRMKLPTSIPISGIRIFRAGSDFRQTHLLFLRREIQLQIKSHRVHSGTQKSLFT